MAGGLGNQLFQYYAGYALAGERPLVDISLGAPRENEQGNVDLFELCPEVTDGIVVPRFRPLHGLARKSFGYCTRFNTTNRGIKKIDFLKILLTISASMVFSIYFGGIYKVYISKGIGDVNRVPSKFPGRIMLIGYFQTQFPFGDLGEISHANFVREFKSIGSSQRESSQNLSEKQSLVIHIRLSDYLNEPKIGCLSKDYFSESISIIGFKPEKIYLFSDNEKMAISELREVTSIPTQVVATEKLSSAETLLLMSQSSNLIISNSSFSWWAATFASELRDVTIIAPDKWFAQQPEPNFLIPSRWKRAKASWREQRHS